MSLPPDDAAARTSDESGERRGEALVRAIPILVVLVPLLLIVLSLLR